MTQAYKRKPSKLSKRFEFVSDDSNPTDGDASSSGAGSRTPSRNRSTEFDAEGLNSNFISSSKALVMAPAPAFLESPSPPATLPDPSLMAVKVQVLETLVTNIFATLSSLKSSYAQLQSAHSPYDGIKHEVADKAVAADIRRLSGLKHSYLERDAIVSGQPVDYSDPESNRTPQLISNQQFSSKEILSNSLEGIMSNYRSEIKKKNAELETLKDMLAESTRQREKLEKNVNRLEEWIVKEVASGLGYWAALLKKLGADIVAVDDFSEKTIPSAFYFPETICIDGEQFVRQGGANGRALFFCWPQKSWNWKANLGITYKQMYQTCLAEACLDAFHGDTVFFVGEKHDGCTFDIAAWMQSSPKHRRTWRLEKEFDIPSWPGVHDIFMCFVRQGEASKHSLGKKKKKAARKAQLVEDAHLSELEKSAKEEDFRKASFAAYPTCSMQ